MKKDLSSLEIKYLVDELQFLLDSKLDKIFQPDKKTLLFQIHKSGVGKQLLRINQSFVYLTKHKEIMPEKLLGFAVFLRKYLGNARIRSISQPNSERVIDFFLEKKEKFHLIVELFRGGNIILCDENYKIINPLERKLQKNRAIKKGQIYILPDSNNVFNLQEFEFVDLLLTSNKKNISTSLAIVFNLGGVYGREICLRANIDPNKEKASLIDAKKLFKSFSELIKTQANAQIIYKDESKDIVQDIVPIKLKLYSENFDKSQIKEFDLFSDALDLILSETIVRADTKEVKSKFEKRIEKIQKMIFAQEASVIKLEKISEINQRKGELIYEKYQEINQILNDIKTARIKYSWKEIKEKLEGHKLIKKVNEKKGEITISFE